MTEPPEFKDCNNVVKAHTYALAGDRASKNGDFVVAAERYHLAATLFERTKEQFRDIDSETSKALSLLASHQRSKNREMARRKVMDTSRRSSDPSVMTPTKKSAAPPASPSKTDTPVSLTEAQALQNVVRDFDSLKHVEGGLGRGEGFCFVHKDQHETVADTSAKEPEESSSSASLLRSEILKLREENRVLQSELRTLKAVSNSRKFTYTNQEKFQDEFHKRFAALKLSMAHFYQVYGQGDKGRQHHVLEQKLADAFAEIKRLTEELRKAKNQKVATSLT